VTITSILVKYYYKELTMPKALSETERNYLKNRLKEETVRCLLHQGLKKTTVDELVGRVNMPKGTFYLLYPSKELLFFDVLMSFHEEIQSDLLLQMKAMGDDVTIEKVTELIFHLYKKVDGSFLASFIASGDLELLMRKLPPKLIQEHAETDDFSMETFLSFLPIQTEEYDIRVCSASLRAVFFTLLHKREIGEDLFDEAIKIMIAGIVSHLFTKKVL